MGKRRLGKQTKEVSEKTKQKIIDAALTAFAREGFYNAKLRDIAEVAGTTHSLIRHHFGSKDDLWKAVVDYGLKLSEQRLKDIIASQDHGDPVALLKTTITSHVQFFARHPALSRILLHNNSRSNPQHIDYILEKQKRVLEIVEPVFKKVQALGYFKGFDHDSFSVYMRALSETPIATSDMTNKLLKTDIRSDEGIAQHAQRVVNFLFHKES